MGNRSLLSLVVVVFLMSCQSGTKITSLAEAKKEVSAYYADGHFGLETYEIIEKAVEDLKDIEITTNAMVVFDVDETVLSNYDHIEAMDFCWIQPRWDEWILEADAKNIPQVKKLYDYCIESNINVAFLTGRYSYQYDATRTNLEAEGFTTFDTLICRDVSKEKLPASIYKQDERKMLTDKGFNIIMCVGDQWSDLEGDYTGIKVKIPNYIYEIK